MFRVVTAFALATGAAGLRMSNVDGATDATAALVELSGAYVNNISKCAIVGEDEQTFKDIKLKKNFLQENFRSKFEFFDQINIDFVLGPPSRLSSGTA